MGGFKIIQVRNLVKKFGYNTALREVDISLRKGSFTVLLGPNGAGKTTLLNILSNVTKPTSGEVIINGEDIKEESDKIRGSIGVISHSTLLYENLTALENLLFYGRMYGVDDIKDKARDLIFGIGLGFCMNDPVYTFSRGMKQRLSIARSIIHDPQILLLDEPFTGLDQHAQDMLKGMLSDLHNGDRAILMATHNLEHGLEMGDEIIILVKGNVVFSGSSASLDLHSLKDIYFRSVEGSRVS